MKMHCVLEQIVCPNCAWPQGWRSDTLVITLQLHPEYSFLKEVPPS